jgi:hypothetical protein
MPEILLLPLPQNTTLSPGTWGISGPSAESFVATLAKEQENNRKIEGIITTGLGLAFWGWEPLIVIMMLKLKKL